MYLNGKVLWKQRDGSHVSLIFTNRLKMMMNGSIWVMGLAPAKDEKEINQFKI